MRAGAILVVLAVVGTGVRVGWADRNAADFFCERGDKALRENSPVAAADEYRKALSEEDGHLRARQGLADALLASGDKATAVDELRKVAAAADRAGLPAAWAGLPARAKKRLLELDPIGSELDQIVERRVSDLLGFADRTSARNPLLAKRAIDRALVLRPGHARAAALLEKMGMPPPGLRTVLFDGTSVAGWAYLEPPEWAVVDGVLRVTAPGETIIRSEPTVGGDFTVWMEARVLEVTGSRPILGLVAALKEDQQSSMFGFGGKILIWQENMEDRRPDAVWNGSLSALPFAFDAREWNVYEMRFRPDRVEGVLNGRVVTTQKRLPLRDGGFVGLQAGNIRAEIRRVEAEVRPTK